MSMFHNRIDSLISNFGDDWGTDQYKFRQYFGINLDNEDNLIMQVRANGQIKEFLRMPIDLFERRVKDAVRSSRVSSSYATRFFAWHWLEETNQLDLFFNTLKEIQNA